MYEDLMSLLMESKAELMQAKGHLMKEELGCQPKECINNEWIKYDLLGAEGLAEDFSTYFFGFCNLSKYDIGYLKYRSVIVDGFRGCASKDIRDQFSEYDQIIPLGDYMKTNVEADEQFMNLTTTERLDRVCNFGELIIPKFREKFLVLIRLNFLTLEKDQMLSNLFVGYKNGEFKEIIVTDRAMSFGGLDNAGTPTPDMDYLMKSFFNGYSSYLHTNALDQLKTISNLEELPTIETTITDEDIDNYTNDCYPTGYVDNIKYVAKYLLNMNKA